MAEEARAVARMKSEQLRRELLQIARGYEALAKLAEATADQHSGTDQAPPEELITGGAPATRAISGRPGGLVQLWSGFEFRPRWRSGGQS
jgi:hypothetical protein